MGKVYTDEPNLQPDEAEYPWFRKFWISFTELDYFTRGMVVSAPLLLLVILASVGIHLTLRQRASSGNPVEYGFTLHTIYNASNNTFTLAQFKGNVDDLAIHHIQWIRVDIASGIVAASGSATHINWNQSALGIYDQALSYAKTKGLKVYLDTNVPYYAKLYTLTDYKSVAQLYYSYLAHRYSQYVDQWQIFNEPNWSNFRDYSQLTSSIPISSYLSDLNSVIMTSSDAIRSQSPTAQTIVNVAIATNPVIPLDQFISSIQSTVDAIGLDMYPGNDPDVLSSNSATIRSIENKYQLPVFVTETGMCTAIFGQDSQTTYIPEYLQTFTLNNPVAVLVYQYQDTVKTDNPCELSFGIIDTNGNPKPAYTAVMTTMEQLSFGGAYTPTPTQTITPTGSDSDTPTPTDTQGDGSGGNSGDNSGGNSGSGNSGTSEPTIILEGPTISPQQDQTLQPAKHLVTPTPQQSTSLGNDSENRMLEFQDFGPVPTPSITPSTPKHYTSVYGFLLSPIIAINNAITGFAKTVLQHIFQFKQQ